MLQKGVRASIPYSMGSEFADVQWRIFPVVSGIALSAAFWGRRYKATARLEPMPEMSTWAAVGLMVGTMSLTLYCVTHFQAEAEVFMRGLMVCAITMCTALLCEPFIDQDNGWHVKVTHGVGLALGNLWLACVYNGWDWRRVNQGVVLLLGVTMGGSIQVESFGVLSSAMWAFFAYDYFWTIYEKVPQQGAAAYGLDEVLGAFSAGGAAPWQGASSHAYGYGGGGGGGGGAPVAGAGAAAAVASAAAAAPVPVWVMLGFAACKDVMMCAANLDMRWKIPNVLVIGGGMLGLGDIAEGGVVCTHALVHYGAGALLCVLLMYNAGLLTAMVWSARRGEGVPALVPIVPATWLVLALFELRKRSGRSALRGGDGGDGSGSSGAPSSLAQQYQAHQYSRIGQSAVIPVGEHEA